MKRIFCDDLMVTLSWTGRGGGIGLKGTRILEAMMRRFYFFVIHACALKLCDL